MKIRLLWSVLVTSAVLLIAGTAFSKHAVLETQDVEIVEFDRATGELFTYPWNEGLTEFVIRPGTLRGLANLTRFLPPDPCLPIARLWNATVLFDRRRPFQSAFIFDELLTL